MIIRTTLNNNYQTAIPKKVFQTLDVQGASYVEWDLDEENKTVTLNFIKKPSLLDISKISRCEK